MTTPTRLTDLALEAVANALRTGRRRLPDPRDLPSDLARPGATFVTLERGGALLGCIGSLTHDQPLGVNAARNAIAAAFDDPRLPPISAADYREMDVKVSVLSSPRPLAVESHATLVAALRPGVDGVIVELGKNRATFLPAVWAKLSEPVAFLDALWDKAGLRPGVWDAHLRVSTYTTEELVDRGPRAAVDDRSHVG
jgi:AmmeMemoRadiSam system protein A